MLEENAKFLDEYNSLDQLIEDAFSSEKGVSEYIDRMYDNVSKKHLVKNFDHDLKILKDLRYKRNQLAHGDVSMRDNYVSEEDIDNVIYFYNLMIDRKDPLTIMNSNKPKTKTNKKNNNKNYGLLISLIVLIILYIIFYIF